MTTTQIIKKFSYLTSCNYFVWMLSSLFIFLPLTMLVLIIKAVKIGFMVARAYLVKRNFKISFSYSTYEAAKGQIERDYIKHYGR